MKKKLKVCMLIPSYFPLMGGSEVQLSGLLRALGPEIEAFVLTRRLKGTASLQREGRATIVRTASPFSPASFFLSSLCFLMRNKARYDVLHVYSFDSPAITGAIIKRLFPEKAFIIRVPRYGPGSALARLEKSYLGRKRLNFILKEVDALVPLSNAAASAFLRKRFPPERIASIPNGVDTENFYPPSPKERGELRRSLGISERAFVGVFVGRLIARKNIMGALKAWRTVVKELPEAVLIVAGSGPDEGRLRSFSREELPEGSIVFFGPAPRNSVPKLLRAADVYVSFSESEGMSNAMLEALSTGLPLIASRGPGIDNLVNSGANGFLVDASNPDEAATRIKELARDRSLRRVMSQNARRLIEQRYSFALVAREVESLYSRLTGTISTGKEPLDPKEDVSLAPAENHIRI